LRDDLGGLLVELVEKLVDVPVDLVADLAHPLERLILRVGKVPTHTNRTFMPPIGVDASDLRPVLRPELLERDPR
jgi:hypothetical protein